ncbi:MAG: hydrogenase 4 subunit B, partial [Rudaea sp.]
MTTGLLGGALAVAAAWVVVGVAGLLRPRDVLFAGRGLFSLGVLGGLALLVIAIPALDLPPQTLVLPLGLPDLPFHMRLDPLAAVFLALIGATSIGISLYSAGYFRAGEGAAPGLL